MAAQCSTHSNSNLSHGLETGLVIRKGCYQRKSDGTRVQRYFCKACGTHFSGATFELCFRQHKRQVNFPVFLLLSAHCNQTTTARLLRLNRKTVARKLEFLGPLMRLCHEVFLDRIIAARGPILEAQFDEMETSEHSKCKPLSIPLVVTKDHLILGVDVAVMPAKGPLATISRLKYGPRADERTDVLRALLIRIKDRLSPGVTLVSDECPRYGPIVREFFPDATHNTEKSRRACTAGQGELKEGGFDPLFAVNQTAAMFRANVCRLIRRTWCTTKKRERLKDHLSLYVVAHNLKRIGAGKVLAFNPCGRPITPGSE